jgi:RNA polymerase sigma factor (sigma-70 family)
MKLIILLLVLLFAWLQEYTVCSFHLTVYQCSLISKLVVSNKLTNIQRDKINRILFKAYDKYSIKQSYDFKKLHYHKCRDIDIREMIMCSRIGLWKAIQRYNGKYNLINYSKIYIKSELLRLLTDKYSLSVLPKEVRTKSKAKYTAEELKTYKQLLQGETSNYYTNWQLDAMYRGEQKDSLHRMTEKHEVFEQIDILSRKTSPEIRNILHLKYLSDDTKVLSNKKIATLLSCSEETIRKKICYVENLAK